MDKFDRIFQLHSILANRRTPIDSETLQARLECSRSTLFRIIALMKDHLGAPIEFDTERGSGFLYRRASGDETYELPGLWFSPAELQSLAVMQRMLRDLGGGLLADQVAAISRRLNQLVQHRRLNLGEAATRLRFPAVASRPAGEAFQIAASATLQRRKLWFEYHSRGSNRRSSRTVSPQRLTHYREAWYLDAWDEESNELRTFAIERMQRSKVLEKTALDLTGSELDAHYASAYGIFGGKADKLAVLRFSAERARWVADEKWHPEQTGEHLADGQYELRIPYHDARELVMDIMRHGAHVEVIEPEPLRRKVAEELRRAAEQYAPEE
ncbi:MAG: helix-turn-helix transcriptional regulator [Steroidobacter sp.]